MSQQLSRRIAALNNKGGVGKTFLLVALAEALARRGRRVLAVDMDPQANLTRRLAVRPAADRTLATLLRPRVEQGSIKTITHPCGWATDEAALIDVAPARLDLEDRALEAGVPGAVHRLASALYGATDGYDYVLIDCPPSMGPLTQMGIAALDHDGEGRPDIADTVLIPVVPEWDAVAGARRVVEFLQTYGRDLGVPHLRPAGLVLNAVRAQTALHTVRTDELADAFPDVPLLATIPQRARIAEVQDAGLPLRSDTSLVTAGLTATVEDLAARIDRPAATA